MTVVARGCERLLALAIYDPVWSRWVRSTPVPGREIGCAVTSAGCLDLISFVSRFLGRLLCSGAHTDLTLNDARSVFRCCV